MNWNRVMRFIYWVLGSFFVLAGAVTVISLLKPGPTEAQVMMWQKGMMQAMHNSLMGSSMERMESYGFLMRSSAYAAVVMIVLGTAVALPLRVWRKK